MQWVSRIELALDEDRFELYGQCIAPIATEQAGLHFEVLLRMREAEGTLVLPGAFLPIAERFHLATRIDRWVVNKSFDWMAQAAQDGIDIELMAINLSGQTLGDRAFHRDIVERIRCATFDVSRICLEITETAAITHLAEARTLIEDLRALGVKVALDDFGAGASSFGYLKSLPVDFLKIDGHFITNLLDDAIDNAAVRCFCEVAKVMGVKTIAEFVERDAVRDELRVIGVDMAQGYLIHKPEPLHRLLSSVLRAPAVHDARPAAQPAHARPARQGGRRRGPQSQSPGPRQRRRSHAVGRRPVDLRRTPARGRRQGRTNARRDPLLRGDGAAQRGTAARRENGLFRALVAGPVAADPPLTSADRTGKFRI